MCNRLHLAVGCRGRCKSQPSARVCGYRRASAFLLASPLGLPLPQGIGLSIYATGSLLMGQMAYDPTTFESHLLTSGWLFASFVIAAAFTAQLASTLSKERMANRVRHVTFICATSIDSSRVLKQSQTMAPVNCRAGHHATSGGTAVWHYHVPGRVVV